MRLQANGQRRWSLREQSAKSIFVCFLVVLELPVFQRPQRERQPGRLAEHLLVITKQARTQQRIDQVLVRVIGGARRRGVDHDQSMIYFPPAILQFETVEFRSSVRQKKRSWSD